MGMCFFAFGNSLGFVTSAMLFFPFCFCGLPELPESSSGTVNGSCITIGCVGGAGGACGAGTWGVCGACA